MKGAKSILCDCGMFFKPVYVREELGKIKKLLECSCGASRKITIDGSIYKEESYKDGRLINSIRDNEYDKSVYKYRPEGGYRVASHRVNTNNGH